MADLRSYVSEARRDGHSDSSIRRKLLDSGHSQKDIDAAMGGGKFTFVLLALLVLIVGAVLFFTFYESSEDTFDHVHTPGEPHSHEHAIGEEHTEVQMDGVTAEILYPLILNSSPYFVACEGATSFTQELVEEEKQALCFRLEGTTQYTECVNSVEALGRVRLIVEGDCAGLDSIPIGEGTTIAMDRGFCEAVQAKDCSVYDGAQAQLCRGFANLDTTECRALSDTGDQNLCASLIVAKGAYEGSMRCDAIPYSQYSAICMGISSGDCKETNLQASADLVAAYTSIATRDRGECDVIAHSGLANSCRQDADLLQTLGHNMYTLTLSDFP